MVNLSKIAHNLEWIENLKGDEQKEKTYKPVAIERIMSECVDLPHGSGLDNGVSIDLNRSKSDKIVFNTEFHHMNENGYYDGWTSHSLIVTPKFGGYDLRITGKNRNGIKEYLYDLFYNVFE